MKVKVSLIKIVVWAFFVISFFCVWAPTMGDSTLLLATTQIKLIKTLIMYFLLVVIIFVCIINRRIIQLDIYNIIIALSPLACIIIDSFSRYGMKTVSPINGLIIILFCISCFSIKHEVYKILRDFICFVSLVTIILYIPATLGMCLWGGKTAYYLKDVGYCIDYYIVSFLQTSTVVRSCGIFNEPGYFGTILGLILIINDIDLKDKKNWIILIAGLLTFSAAFFILIMFYYVLRRTEGKIAIRIIVLFFAITLFIILNSLYYTYYYMNEGYLWRLIGIINGSNNNRSYATINNMMLNTLKTDYRWFGHGGGYVGSIIGDLSIKKYIVDYGVLGCFIIYGVILIPSVFYSLRVNKNCYFIILYIISIYQRPNVFSLFYYIILFEGIRSYTKKNASFVNSV